MAAIENKKMKFRKNQIIFKEGDSANCMYDIQWGKVGIYADYGTKQEVLLTELGADAYFGEMGLVDDKPRSATAVALENDTVVSVITVENFANFLYEKPGKVMMIMQQMSGRIRGLTADYLDACRAVAESVESEETGAEKSGWFKSTVQKFLDDFRKNRN